MKKPLERLINSAKVDEDSKAFLAKLSQCFCNCKLNGHDVEFLLKLIRWLESLDSQSAP